MKHVGMMFGGWMLALVLFSVTSPAQEHDSAADSDVTADFLPAASASSAPESNAQPEPTVEQTASVPAESAPSTEAEESPAQAEKPSAEPVQVAADAQPLATNEVLPESEASAPEVSVNEQAVPESVVAPVHSESSADAVAASEQAQAGSASVQSLTIHDFQLDRGHSVGGDNVLGQAAPVPKKRSLWSRLWGKEPKQEDVRHVAEPQQIVLPPAVPSPAKTPAVVEPTPVPVASSSDLPAAGPAAPQTPLLKEGEDLIAVQEEVRRQAKEVEGLQLMDQAYQAMSRNEFDVALKLFAQALEAMPARPHTMEIRQKARQSQAECEYRIALDYCRLSQWSNAQDAARRALGYFPGHLKAMKLLEKIKLDEQAAAARAAMPVPVRHEAEHLSRQQRINEFLSRGRQYYAIKEYKDAEREFRNVLAIDEKNAEAAAWLEKLYGKLYVLETDHMKRMQAEMVAQVRDTWTPPVKRDISAPIERKSEETVQGVSRRRLVEKLKRIKIPQFQFSDADIKDVIDFLQQASVACDAESPPNEKGVNIVLNIGAMGGECRVPHLNLSDVDLESAIRLVVETAVPGLKYHVDEKFVTITPINAPVGDLVVKSYRIQPSLGDTIVGSAQAAASTAASSSPFDTFGTVMQTTDASGGDVRQFFVDAGVSFPEGASCLYRRAANLLIVKNTAANLDEIERIIGELNEVPKQIEIEARFVEVQQTDLEELGVEWLLNDNWQIAENASAGSAIPLAGRERIQINKNNMTKGLRTLGDGVAKTGGNMAGIFSISSVLTNPELTFILHALEQRSGANLLSAPKVTTKSGAQATIKIVREIRYPTTFEIIIPQASGSTTTGNQESRAYVQPGDFETKELGVILSVTPTLANDNYSIDLRMQPQVLELVEWLNYGYTVPLAAGDQFVNMPQPVFHVRDIFTDITIWDGQTVVMGGLINEQQTTTEDKIPILGDIPVLGYLFKSKTSNNKKFNLLIFVTAHVVDPAGKRIRDESGKLISALSADAIVSDSSATENQP